MKRSLLHLATLLIVLFSVIGCGDARQSLLPTAPSSAMAPASLSSPAANSTADADAATNTNVVGATQTQPTADVEQRVFTQESNQVYASEEVEGEGRVTSVVAGTTCPTLEFVVQGHRVKTTALTQYEGGACRDIQVGAKVEVTGTRQADGSVLARRVEFEEHEVEGEGRVTSVVAGTTCPTLEFVVQGHRVKTTALTQYEGGVCADIRPGVKVEVTGTRQADGSVLARRVEFEEHEVEGEGRVTSVVAGTACPTLEFVVRGHRVKTTALTQYEGGACRDIQPGVEVEVKGTRQADGTVLARRIEFED